MSRDTSQAQRRPLALLRLAAKVLTGRPHSWPAEAGEGRTLLDVGCLTGGKLQEFQERGWRVFGVDLNQEAIEIAREAVPGGVFHCGPLESLDHSLRFDVIRSDNVIEHVPDPSETLRQMRARLVPGGRLFLYVPSGDSLSIRLLRGRSAACWVPFHLHLLSRAGVSHLLRGAGFRNVRVRTYSPISWWPISFIQLVGAPGFARRSLSAQERAAARLASALAPVWIASSWLGLGEELVAEATVP